MTRLISALLLAGMALFVSAPCVFAQETPSPDSVVPPRVIKDVKPRYTTEARNKKITGRVELECVVQPDGTPAGIRVTRSLDPDLDAEATKALQQWRFRPGQKNGQPVPVTVTIEMTFTLRDKSAVTIESNKQPETQTPPAEAPPPTEVYKPGPGISAPVVLEQLNPPYPPEAMKSHIQGRVMLQCIVLTDGSVAGVRVVHSLDPVLDEQSIETLKQWKFKPGMKDGTPVPVQIEIEMTFSLR